MERPRHRRQRLAHHSGARQRRRPHRARWPGPTRSPRIAGRLPDRRPCTRRSPPPRGTRRHPIQYPRRRSRLRAGPGERLPRRWQPTQPTTTLRGFSSPCRDSRSATRSGRTCPPGANATSHIALWSDLTRRAPADVKAAPATMLAFASWLHGNGALAWCALDQVPHDQRYCAAELVTTLVQNGLHPSTWDSIKAEIATARPSGLDQPTERPTTRPAKQPPTI
ncbi:DUF4192 family protein [Nocardioides daphniae]|uniref:DUF4192 family protein n=1 Tax=Nocardioides daphniae TaxID=402297 RepID=UPI0013158FB9|nr:DUF4192 family protein [Nocardioides daphniae]